MNREALEDNYLKQDSAMEDKSHRNAYYKTAL